MGAQSISGNLSLYSHQKIKLEGYSGIRNYTVAEAQCDSLGNFVLPYSLSDSGIGYLTDKDNVRFIIILSGEDIEIKGESLNIYDSINILKSDENKLFIQYSKDRLQREQALNAWHYLERVYLKDSIFAKQVNLLNSIQEEIKRLEDDDNIYLNNLPPQSYIRRYLPLRKLVNSVYHIAQYKNEEIPGTIETFRALNYNDPNLYKSGLLKEIIISHFWLIENSGLSLDSIFIEMKKSIDLLILNLTTDERTLNDVTELLFNLLESRSLFKASEYLALKMLNESKCIIDNDVKKLFETYRTMKPGNIAPNIEIVGDIIAPGRILNKISYLSDIKSKYKVLIFGASWCHKCSEELLETAQLYSEWKRHDIEVIFISLDEDKQLFQNYVKIFPFISVCDYRKWDSKAVKDFYVSSTPTIYLLDDTHNILLRPNSVKHLDTWIDWVLVKDHGE